MFWNKPSILVAAVLLILAAVFLVPIGQGDEVESPFGSWRFEVTSTDSEGNTHPMSVVNTMGGQMLQWTHGGIDLTSVTCRLYASATGEGYDYCDIDCRNSAYRMYIYVSLNYTDNDGITHSYGGDMSKPPNEIIRLDINGAEELIIESVTTMSDFGISSADTQVYALEWYFFAFPLIYRGVTGDTPDPWVEEEVNIVVESDVEVTWEGVPIPVGFKSYRFSVPSPEFADTNDAKFTWPIIFTDTADLVDYPDRYEMLGLETFVDTRIYDGDNICCNAKYTNHDTGEVIFTSNYIIPDPPSGYEYWNWYRIRSWIGHCSWEISGPMTVDIDYTLTSNKWPTVSRTVQMTVIDSSQLAIVSGTMFAPTLVDTVVSLFKGGDSTGEGSTTIDYIHSESGTFGSARIVTSNLFSIVDTVPTFIPYYVDSGHYLGSN